MRGWILLVVIGLAGCETPYRSCIAIIFLLKGMLSAMTFGKPVSARRETRRLCSARTSAGPMRILGTFGDSDFKAHQCVA